ncbi:MAG: polysaccharide deacetylase [Ruminococcaceae bacterium]|nr:polysaccharide deacetylase [Oscillospiraceae bacterium]
MRVRTNLYPGGKCRALTMSYDDGRIHDRRLIEIFNRYGIRGTFHLNSGKLDQEDFVTSAEVATLYAGHEVSLHTVTHPYLEITATEELIYEVMEDRRVLESLCGYPVRGMSYPFGTYNTKVVEQLRALGIRYSRTTQATNKLYVPDDFLMWHPTCHHKNDIMAKLESFRKRPGPGALLYIWGHSYEFANHNNWELMEEFCAAAGGDKDTWYATNIEIYDYITAQRSLTLSADRTMAYNPSAISVWVGIEGEPVECKPGVVTKF